MPNTPQKKRYALLSLAVVLFALAAVTMLLGSGYASIRPFAGLACIAGAYLARMSKGQASQSFANVPVAGVGFTEQKRFRRLLWVRSIALVPLLGVAWILMYVDQANGGNETWPAYVVFGVTLACAAVWSGLVGNISNSR
jgi:hypothetical protein